MITFQARSIYSDAASPKMMTEDNINPEDAATRTLIKLIENARRDLKTARELRLMTNQEELEGELDALEAIEGYLATVLRSIDYRRSEHFDEEQQYVTPLHESQMEHLIAMAQRDEPEWEGTVQKQEPSPAFLD
jgi:hypothetical protein